MKKIAFFNPQGNFDKNDSHLTEHPDFGGQLVYVKELAKAIASKGIQVDIITRQIIDENWPEFSEPFDYYPDSTNLRIVRIPFGGKKFLNKENLWKHLPEYVEGIYSLYKKEESFPDFVTTHYGDGGISGVLFLEKTDIPFSFTGHSLGAWKLEKMLNEGFSQEELEKKYKFSVRIFAENLAIKYSSFVVCSTSHERYVQYSHKLYNADPNSDKFKVIPPGINSKIFNFKPHKDDEIIENYLNNVLSSAPKERQKLPFIILSSRIDRKKNHIAVVRAFLKNKDLKENANLIIVVRAIDDVIKFVNEKNSEESEILREIINEGKKEIGNSIFFLNISDQKSLASLYRVAAKRNSVFTLPSHYEPFGLAIIEAAACGLVVSATKYGGPAEILSDNKELLFDPENVDDIANKLYIALTKYNNSQFIKLSRKYTWESTADKYLENIDKVLKNKLEINKKQLQDDIKKFLSKIL
ncbi:MAG: sucrose-phosphate synthase [Thermosipho sp. (in: thermotogales)]|jgi:sucrose-phosphate synthase|nr:sucrose-phosphate synthase [Thermosipho sp. (in: thermotogales)]